MAPEARQKRGHSRVALWAGIAALIHLELLLVAGVALHYLAPRDAEVAARLAERGIGERVEIGMVDEEAAREIVAELERRAEEAKEEKVKEEIESVKAPGQVVDIPRPRVERRPDDARFAGEYDSTVERETKRYGKFDDKAQQGDTGGKAEVSRPAVPAAPAPAKPSVLAMRPPGPRMPETEGGVLAQGGGTEEQRDRPSGAESTTPALMPSEQQLARAVGGGTQDALKDIDDGEETALNSKKWKFASFFNRVKRQVADHWHPDEAYRRRDPTGAVYGHRDRLTILRIQLKPDGSLANVGIEQACGVDFLDDEAIEAFKQAQPFPNPPRQLLEDGGTISFRFGFLFELGSAPRMRFLRSSGM